MEDRFTKEAKRLRDLCVYGVHTSEFCEDEIEVALRRAANLGNADQEDLLCQFCGDAGFDLIGLKAHMLRHCEAFDNCLSPEQEQRERAGLCLTVDR